MGFYELGVGQSSPNLPSPAVELWRDLALTTDQGDPFCCSPVWNLTYNQLFYPDSRVFWLASPTSLLLLREHARLPEEIILAPLEDGWLFGQPLLGPDAPLLLDYALNVLREIYAPVEPAIILSGVRENHPHTWSLYHLFCSRYIFYRCHVSSQCSASLAGGVAGWLSRRSANQRAKLRKACRRASAQGIEFERSRPLAPTAAAHAYARMLHVERQSWKGIGHCGMTESPAREFYASLIERLALRGAARVIFARRAGEDIGFIFGGIAGGIYRGQQFSYAAPLAHLSLGNIMQYEKIRWLCEEGVSRYDMGPITGERMQYKAHWTEARQEIQTWLMKRRQAANS